MGLRKKRGAKWRYEMGLTICYGMGVKVTIFGGECNSIKNVTN